MSIFLNLERFNPHRLFATVLSRSRLSMTTAYQASFAAHSRCVDLLERHRYGTASLEGHLDFPVYPDGSTTMAPTMNREDLDGLWVEAVAEDIQADQQAGPVILTADDALQRFAKGVLKKAPGLNPGYGPTYGPSYGPPVHLTTLLRAGTNTLRHVSEWDENPNLRLPYPDPAVLKPGSAEWQAMQTINVIQRAFGIGKNELIRNPVSSRVLVAVDGQLGTADPSYERFEDAVIAAARDIAANASLRAVKDLDEDLKRVGLVF